MEKRAHVYYSGRVQGVGFRFTAVSIASNLKVKGWVKNLPDGRVELLAEAEEDTLKDFLERVKGYFSGYLRDAEIEWGPAAGDLSGFNIEF